MFTNSEDEVFKKIADYYGAKFYKRPKELASDETNNDEFLIDFMNNIKGDILIQILPTSPLLKVNEIKNFVNLMLQKNMIHCFANKHQLHLSSKINQLILKLKNLIFLHNMIR